MLLFQREKLFSIWDFDYIYYLILRHFIVYFILLFFIYTHINYIFILFPFRSAYPRIQPFSFSDKLTEGQNTKALCTVLEGIGPYKFLWYKNDQALTSSIYTSIESSKDYSLLLINSLSTDHAGNYTCAVTGSSGRDTYSSQLIVNGK